MLVPTRYLCVARASCPCRGNAAVVHIPLNELEFRQHELAPRWVEMQLVGTGLDAYHALGWLHARGRRARLVDSAPSPVPSPPRYRLWEPNEFLQQVVPLLKVGAALDLGCGSGREAVYLAERGWQVVAVDRLPDALQRGRDLQARYAPDAPPIQWIQADLEADWQPAQAFDLVVCCFFLHRPLVRRVAEWLKPGGHLVMECFTTVHRDHFGRPASDERVVQPDELPALLPPAMQVHHYAEGWHTRGHTARLWATRSGTL